MDIMDLDSFIDEMDGDIGDVKMIVSQFILSIKDQIPLILDYINSRDYESLTREAHSIKGGARNIMANNLEVSSEALELSSRANDIPNIYTNFEKLNISFKQFENFALKNSLIE